VDSGLVFLQCQSWRASLNESLLDHCRRPQELGLWVLGFAVAWENHFDQEPSADTEMCAGFKSSQFNANPADSCRLPTLWLQLWRSTVEPAGGAHQLKICGAQGQLWKVSHFETVLQTKVESTSFVEGKLNNACWELGVL
jgi:hypothetical protein